jgi:protein TonB
VRESGVSSPESRPPVPADEGSFLASRNPDESWHNYSDRLMAEQTTSSPVTSDGHIAVQVDGLHAPELTFSFERRQSSLGVGGAFAAHGLFFIIALLIIWYAPSPDLSGPIQPTQYPKDIVWLNQPGPGGGGGGGGNQMQEPPKKAELPGADKVTVPVVKPPAPAQKPPEEPKDPALNIPAKTTADAQQMQPGMLEAAMAASMVSQGTGTDGGGGSGKGGGIGPGDGNGLGPGTGGGTGGGYYQVGNGVESPQLVRQVRPAYTAEAMRAKVQGVVVVQCVVMQDGTVGEAHVIKSLDSVFGLDQEAIKAARQWKFIPGRRFGQPVNVQISIELTFTLR